MTISTSPQCIQQNNKALNKTVAILSPHFPPSSLAGVHRARHLAKHLPAHGWLPTIIRADHSHYTEREDPGLAALVPQTVQQVATGAVPASLARLVGIGDIGLRGYLHFKQALARVATASPPRAVLITGSPFYPMLMAGWVRRSLRVPVVLDFQDPWVSAWGKTLPVLSKGKVAHQLATVLEPRALRHAAFITSVSEVQNQEMIERYQWLDPRRLAAIPIGGDPDDFKAQRSTARTASALNGRVELAYVGSVWPRLASTLDAFLDGVALAIRSNPDIADRLVIRFYGTDARLVDPPIYQVAPLARQRGLSAIVEEFPRRLAFVDALAAMANAQGLILLGSDEPHYTASKIYPALMSGRPFLSVFHGSSSAHEILRNSGGGIALGFESREALPRLATSISDALTTLAFQPDRLGTPNPAAYEAYTAHSVAGRFAEIFNHVSSESSGQTCALPS